MAGPKLITPTPIPDIVPSGPSSFWTPYENDRPLNVIGYADEYDEYESIVITRENAREYAQDYHDRGLRAREAAKKFKDYDRVGRVIQHDPNDYISFRYTATTPRPFNGAPFDPDEFDFDKIVWETSNIDALGNPKNVSNYDGYAAMRMNIAVLRNIVYNQYFPDGKYDAEDPADREHYSKLKEMARFLGNAIENGVFVKAANANNTLTDAATVPINEANRPDYGAKVMYQYLIERQSTHSKLPINGVFGSPAYDWGLQPIDRTALSDEALNSFFNATADLHDVTERLHDHLAGHAEGLRDTAIRAANAFSRPEELPQDTRAFAIREARNILEKFKGIYDTAERGKAGPTAGENEIIHHSVFLPMEAATLAKLSNHLGQIYLRNVSVLLQGGPMDADLQQIHARTVHAMGELAFAVRNQSIVALSRDLNDPLRQEKLKYLTEGFGKDGSGNPLPHSWADVRGQQPHSMRLMIEQVEQGLEEVHARLRMRGIQQQDSAALARGDEFSIMPNQPVPGRPNTPPGGNQLPQQILQSNIFSDATRYIREQASAGQKLEAEFSAKMQQNAQGKAGQQTFQNTVKQQQLMDKDHTTAGIQHTAPNPAQQQRSQQSGGNQQQDQQQQQRQQQLRQQQLHLEQQMAEREARRQRREARSKQSSSNQQAQRQVTLMQNLSSRVRRMLRMEQRQQEQQQQRATSVKTTHQSARSAQVQTSDMGSMEPVSPGAHLPGKQSPTKSRGI